MMELVCRNAPRKYNKEIHGTLSVNLSKDVCIGCSVGALQTHLYLNSYKIGIN